MSNAVRYALNNMVSDTFIQRTEAGQNRIQSFAGLPFCDRLQNGNPFVIAVSVCVLFSISFAASSLSGFGPGFGGCKIELESRINPNDAPVASLVRLPGIGIGRAGTIVAYREEFTEQQGEGQPFQNCSDLQKVKGIGPKTVKNINEWLKFE